MVGIMPDPDSEDPDLAIVVPHTNSVSMRWAIRFATLDLPSHHVVARSTAALDLARERTVEDALSAGVDWLLFLDSDVIPPEDVFPLLRRHDRRVVSGVYYVPGVDSVVYPAVWRLDDGGELKPVEVDDDGRILSETGEVLATPDASGLVTVDAIGLGCALVHRSVFEAVDRPWFRWTKGYESHPWDLSHEGEVPGISEDFYFCHKVGQAGFDVHLDTSVQCAHEKRCLLTDDGAYLESQIE